MKRVLAELLQLGPGEYVVMRHRREPLPLYAMLPAMGFLHRTVCEPAEYRIYIWRGDDVEAAAHCGPADPPP